MKIFLLFLIIAGTNAIDPCGTFVRYDVKNNRTAPESYGFVGGLNFDSTQEYVGYGYNDCGNPTQQTKCPGFVSTNSVNPGVYMSCRNGLNSDKLFGYYLLNNSSLQWVSTSNDTMASVPNKLSTNDTYYEFYFGRVLYNGQFRVGKIHAIPADGLYFVNELNQEQLNSTNFEILTCASSPATTTTSSTTIPPTTTAPVTTQPPTTTTTIDPLTYPCGTFLRFDVKNGRTAPESYGFVGGLNYDSTIEYVGYGYNDCGNPTQQSKCPGFISTNSVNPGVYMSCRNGLNFDKLLGYYLLSNPNLKWIRTTKSAMASVENKLSTNDTSYVFYFGRTFYDGEYRVGKIHASPADGLYFVNELNIEKVYPIEFEILICAPQTP